MSCCLVITVSIPDLSAPHVPMSPPSLTPTSRLLVVSRLSILVRAGTWAASGLGPPPSREGNLRSRVMARLVI